MSDAAPKPPGVRKGAARLEKFGRVFVDDYAWLRDVDWFDRLHTPERLNPEIRTHLEAENAYCDAVLAPTQALQAQMVEEILHRSSAAAAPPPEPDGPFVYSSRLEPGAEHPRLLRRPVDGGPEELLLDAQAEAQGKPYYRLSDFTDPTPSPDHHLFAWAADETGDQHFRLYVKDLASGERAASVVEHGYGPFAFSPDSQWLYWVYRDPVSRPTRVYRRPAMGGEDVLVYEEADPAFFLDVERARSNAGVLIKVFNGHTSETWIIPAEAPTAPPRCIAARQAGVTYDVHPWGDRYVIRTNADGAVDYKLMLADPADPQRAHWVEWLPHRPGRFIAEVRVYRDHLARIEWVDANPTLLTLDRAGAETIVPMAEAAYAISLTGRAYDTAALAYRYESPATPPRWFEYDMATGVQRLVQETTVEGFDPAAYVVRRLFAPAADGASIPITVLARADLAMGGAAPLHLFGYGSYAHSLPPSFSPASLSLVDRGWVAAIAHIRGGGERGPGWYAQVLKAGKPLSITDFIACADHLVAQGYTRAGRIVSHSFSAGGIVIGGAANRRPELWAGLINRVPFVDVLNSTHDTTNPLIPSALSIWGDPADPEMFEVIAGYSPYENITAQPYPAALAIGGLLDNRVGYWEPAKWVARLRERSTSGRPVLLRTDMTAGHQGHAGRLPEAQRAAFLNAFAIWAAGEV